jgi:hypothetical protein
LGPASAGAKLPESKPCKRLNHKPSALKGFRREFERTLSQKGSLKKKNPTDKSKFEIPQYPKNKERRKTD